MWNPIFHLRPDQHKLAQSLELFIHFLRSIRYVKPSSTVISTLLDSICLSKEVADQRSTPSWNSGLQEAFMTNRLFCPRSFKWLQNSSECCCPWVQSMPMVTIHGALPSSIGCRVSDRLFLMLPEKSACNITAAWALRKEQDTETSARICIHPSIKHSRVPVVISNLCHRCCSIALAETATRRTCLPLIYFTRI
ncbi:uncharacterized protein BT62DRAFT_202302 [Guyanagaster necrorhizus]|uniref:Uncharacterized protein n=1 Tax=Guyanagaster necrorhizus TaxID=856835 RepID=A0A9P7VPF2_9AGAR|nr:uncharacterized protein BT62DRAFT_202302 [Guyanagaster necrorhizus MCA 3950]KAG7444973.1 hypothetical protein BT62DRAFT_202302 [Guyanagaster necrorhizus MCA 3950]